VVGSRGFGVARPDGRDGAEGINSPLDLGQDVSPNAAVTVASGIYVGSNASVTLVHVGAYAAVALVVTG